MYMCKGCIIQKGNHQIYRDLLFYFNSYDKRYTVWQTEVKNKRREQIHATHKK